MTVKSENSGVDARTRPVPGGWVLVRLMGPALTIVAVLFGGGLTLGLLQSLGHLPAAGAGVLTVKHFVAILGDPDFLHSLLLTLYIAATSTVVAAGISVVMALILIGLAPRNRVVHFIFQIPLTVPHLVIAAAVAFMLSPTGLCSRVVLKLGLISSSADFPLLINDRWGIGIMLAYVWKEIPFITLMILAVLRHTGMELLEVGQTLKAGRWQRLRYIILPTIFPSLAAASLIVFAYTFGAFEVPFLLGQTYPMMLPVWAYKNYSDVDLLARPEGIATGMLIALVVAIAIVLAQGLSQAARRRGIVL
ncbi:MAG: ABC transporter permease subunit [Desulfobacterales bacterium]|nr:MAG: ABC transporter permease subunit [Desulfobacterales bacterium]